MTDREKNDPRQLIALLSPQAVDFLHIPGGWQHITPDLVAAALATVSDEASAFGKLKYARMDSLAAPLTTMANNLVTQPPYRRTYPRFAGDREVRVVVKLALTEAVHPTVCDVCNNRKFAMIGSLKVTCLDCSGTGMWFSNDEKRADVLRITAEEWGTRWRRLHSTVIGLTKKWDDRLYKAMAGIG